MALHLTEPNPFACHCTVTGEREELVVVLVRSNPRIYGASKDSHPRPRRTHKVPLFSRDACSGSRSARGGYNLRNWAFHSTLLPATHYRIRGKIFPIIDPFSLRFLFNPSAATLSSCCSSPLSVLYPIFLFPYASPTTQPEPSRTPRRPSVLLICSTRS